MFVSDLEKGMSNGMRGLAKVIRLLRFMGTNASQEDYRRPLQRQAVSI